MASGNVIVDYEISYENLDVYKEVPNIKGYYINGYGKVIDDKNNEIKSYKYKNTQGLMVKLNGENYRLFYILFLTFNPYNLSDIDGYRYLKQHNNIVFKDEDLTNVSIGNVYINKKGINVMSYKDKSIVDTHGKEVYNFWDFDENTKLGLIPYDFKYGSNKIVSWKCEKGHKFKMKVSDFMKRPKCKECELPNNISLPQQIMYAILYNNFDNVVLEKRLDKYWVDIYIEDINVAIEYDGHKWHNDSIKLQRDVLKESLIKEKWRSDIIRVREEGCGVIDSLGVIYTYNYEKGCYNDFKYLKEIAYSIVSKYKENVKYLKDEDFINLNNLIWTNSENSILKTNPKLLHFYSSENKIPFESNTFGVIRKVLWECPNCHNKFESRINIMTNKKEKNYCSKCHYIVKEDYHEEILNEYISKKDNESNIVENKDFVTLIDGKLKNLSKPEKLSKREDIGMTKLELYNILIKEPNLRNVSIKFNCSLEYLITECKRLGINSNDKYYLDEFKRINGYTYQSYKLYKEFVSDKDDLNIFLELIERETKNSIVFKNKVMSKGVYDVFVIKFNLKPPIALNQFNIIYKDDLDYNVKYKEYLRINGKKKNRRE